MTVKMDYFDYDLVENYYRKNLIDNNFWMFLSHGGEQLKPISRNTARNSMEFLEKTVAGIRLYPNDFSFMIPIRFWQQNEIYAEYDDKRVLADEPFFIAVEPEIESGNYHVFKCISNNYNSRSTERPTFNQSIQDGIYEGGDGYVWKYMTSVPFIEYRKFAARGFMPIFRNKLVENIAKDGINLIKVENRESNLGYELLNGEIESIDIATNTVVISAIRRLSTTGGALAENQGFDFQIENFYGGRNFRINSAISNFLIGSKSFTIVGSGVNENSRRFFRLNSVEGITEGDPFEITPRIEINGDGENARALPIFENNRITAIRMLDFGSGYKNATAKVISPLLGFAPDQGDIEAILRPIISPDGGHGKNVLNELNSSAVSVSTLVSSREDSAVPSSGTYSKIGLVKNPSFESFAVFTSKNRVEAQEKNNIIVMESIDGLEVGMTVSFESNIPLKTTIKQIFTGSDSIQLSANITANIPEFSNITFSIVGGSFDNRIEITSNDIPVGLQAWDEVRQGNVIGYIQEINLVNNTIFLANYNGDFSETFVSSQPLLTRLGSIGINTIKYSPYKQKTGNVLYTSDITPIEREEDKVEQLRLIIQF